MRLIFNSLIGLLFVFESIVSCKLAAILQTLFTSYFANFLLTLGITVLTTSANSFSNLFFNFLKHQKFTFAKPVPGFYI